jgi:hypothetical protein
MASSRHRGFDGAFSDVMRANSNGLEEEDA